MDVEETVRDSQVLLEQMTEEPEAVLEALQPAERTEVVTELRALSGRAAEVQTEAELVEVADAVHRLVEETPALAALLLPKEMDVTRARKRRKTRKITVDQHEAAYSKDLHAQEHAARIRNRVVECRGQLEQALQSFAEAKSEGDR